MHQSTYSTLTRDDLNSDTIMERYVLYEIFFNSYLLTLYMQPISEDRTLTPKYSEIKLQALFLHASPAYLTAVRLGSGTTPYSTNSAIFATNLRDPATGTNFYVVRQVSNSVTTAATFSLNVNTSSTGVVSVPRYGGSITLAGRESKILVTDYAFGTHKLTYSTAEVRVGTSAGNRSLLI